MKMPKVSCSWCTGFIVKPDVVTPPCAGCRRYALGVIAASEAPADRLDRASVKYKAARAELHAAQKQFRKARKAAKRAGVLQ